MGRRPTPTAVKKLNGNPGKRALPKNEPRPQGGLPDMPAGMSKDAQKEWKRLAPELDKLGLLTRIDCTAFVVYCECYASFMGARRAVEKHGRVLKAENGLLKKNPAVSMMAEAMRLMRQYLIEFGLTPAARPRVASQMKDPAQLTLPGTDVVSVDPEKPTMPTGPFEDEDFFDTDRTRH